MSAAAHPTIAEIEIAEESAAWARLGFEVADGRCRVGGVSLSLVGPHAGRGIVGWSVRGLATAELDGLPTEIAVDPPPAPAPAHPNGVIGLDHVVALTPSLERTTAALDAAGLGLRRLREVEGPDGPVRQAFFRLGEALLEVVERAELDGPARFWGMVMVVDDIDACAQRLGDDLGTIRDAVQPGRRIATLRRSAGLALPVAFISRDPARLAA